MGIPYRERNLSVIAVIVDGSNDEIGAMTGKLGAIPGVSVKAALRRKEAEVLEGPREPRSNELAGKSRKTESA